MEKKHADGWHMVSKLDAGMAMRCRISCEAGMGDTIAYMRMYVCYTIFWFVLNVFKAGSCGLPSNIKFGHYLLCLFRRLFGMALPAFYLQLAKLAFGELGLQLLRRAWNLRWTTVVQNEPVAAAVTIFDFQNNLQQTCLDEMVLYLLS